MDEKLHTSVLRGCNYSCPHPVLVSIISVSERGPGLTCLQTPWTWQPPIDSHARRMGLRSRWRQSAHYKYERNPINILQTCTPGENIVCVTSIVWDSRIRVCHTEIVTMKLHVICRNSNLNRNLAKPERSHGNSLKWWKFLKNCNMDPVH